MLDLKEDVIERSSWRLPNFFVIGAMRSGTTALARGLEIHPEVLLSSRKETHFFDRNYERGLDWYLRFFEEARDHKAVGEATPSYMYDRNAMALMAKMLPDARLLAILRNPVDRAYSHFWHEKNLAREPLGFAEAIDRESERINRGNPAERSRFAYLGRGHYLEQLEYVCRFYAREQLHMIIFERFRADPHATFCRIWEFLEVDTDFDDPRLAMPRGTNRVRRSRTLHRLGTRLPKPLRERIQRINTTRPVYPPMPEGVRAELVDAFRPHNKAFEQWMGEPIPEWDE